MGSATLLDAFNATAGFGGRLFGGLEKRNKAVQDIEKSNQLTEYQKVQDRILVNAAKFINDPEGFEDYKKAETAGWRDAADEKYDSEYYRRGLDEIQTSGDVALTEKYNRLVYEHWRDGEIAKYDNAMNGVRSLPLFDADGGYNTVRADKALVLTADMYDAGMIDESGLEERVRNFRKSEAVTALDFAAKNAVGIADLEDRFRKLEENKKENFGEIPDWDGLVKTALEYGEKRIQNANLDSYRQYQVSFLQKLREDPVGASEIAAKKARERDNDIALGAKGLSTAGKIEVLSFFRMPEEKKQGGASVKLIEQALKDDDAIKVLVKRSYDGDPSLQMNSAGLRDAYIEMILNRHRAAGIEISESGDAYYRGEYGDSIAMKIIDNLKKLAPDVLQKRLERARNYAESVAPAKEMAVGSPEALRAASEQAAVLMFIQDKITEENIAHYARNPDVFDKELADFIAVKTLKSMGVNMRASTGRIGLMNELTPAAVNSLGGADYYPSSAVKEKLLELRNAQGGLLLDALGVSGGRGEVESSWELTEDGNDVNPTAIWKISGLRRDGWDKRPGDGWYKIVVEDGLEKIKFSSDRGKTWGKPEGIDDRLEAKKLDKKLERNKGIDEPYNPYGTNKRDKKPYNPYERN